jgi:uncharacterized protein
MKEDQPRPPGGTNPADSPVDMHVHIVGNGSSGSGCWIRLHGFRRWFARWMLHDLGLPGSALDGDLDNLYVERLLELTRASSLGAVVILATEQPYHSDGSLMEGAGAAYVPNHYVLELARRHPEFLPAVSIHPARKDALEELERCLEGGAAMMKILPNCQNIDCNDPRYTPFWETMAQAGLPLLAHTGGEHTLPIIRPAYSDPRRLELPLRCGVTVIAAHCATKSGFTDPEYFHLFTEMTRRHPNLYGDNSAFNVPIRGRHTPECRQPPLVDQIVHGSDFPVPVHGHWSWMRGFVDWKTFRRWEKHKNPLERDYQLKRAMGFPDETFTRIRRLLRQPSKPARHP